MSDLQLSFANAVRRRRSELGVTQEELAWRAGMHRTYLANIESGRRNPSLRSIGKLAQALGISLPALFDWPGNAGHPAVEVVRNGFHARAVNILLIEDNDDDAELALEAFRRARVANHVHVIRDGAAALEHLLPRGARNAMTDTSQPDLILLDLGLPKVPGLEVLRRIRAHRRTRAIPVIVLTGSREEGDMAACRRLGVEQYLLKPVGFCALSEVTPRLNLSWALVTEIQGTRK